MFDRFLSNPTLVIGAAVVVTALVGWWRYVDHRNDPHARPTNDRQGRRRDDG
ncbi:MAG: hypothetical protein K0Q72_1042 [Armatimonadetes bacterium]|jgi:hypothetical protein|nr:hypothetical protein [Armatimonadota bacterium]